MRSRSTWRAAARALAVGAPLAALGVAALGWYAARLGPYRLRHRDQTVPIRGLPPAFDGLRILHLSDFHTDSTDPRQLAMIAEATAWTADLIAITGDFVRRRGDVGAAADLVRPLRAPLGVYAVLGNHDHGSRRGEEPARAAELRAALEELGIVELANRGIPLAWGGDLLWLAGVDDPHDWRDDLDEALAGRPPGAPVVLLAHSPDILPEATRAGVDLILCGHTHGGQLRLPFVGAPITNTRRRLPMAGGLWREGSTWINVSGGLGGEYRFRVGVPPESVTLTLRSTAD